MGKFRIIGAIIKCTQIDSLVITDQSTANETANKTANMTASKTASKSASKTAKHISNDFQDCKIHKKIFCVGQRNES